MSESQTPSAVDEAVIAVVKRRHPFLASYRTESQRLALVEARLDVEAALPILRAQFEKEVEERLFSSEALCEAGVALATCQHPEMGCEKHGEADCEDCYLDALAASEENVGIKSDLDQALNPRSADEEGRFTVSEIRGRLLSDKSLRAGARTYWPVETEGSWDDLTEDQKRGELVETRGATVASLDAVFPVPCKPSEEKKR